MATYENQIDAKQAAQKAANYAGCAVYVVKQGRRYEVTHKAEASAWRALPNTTCGTCGGSGINHLDGDEICETCNGTGR